ncbi:hypothetical protein ACROYT_G036522 [Oculina patagonica]
MDCREDEEGPQRSLIAPALLSLPAKDVLSYTKVRDPLSMRLNIVGALKNWKDVADLLSYSPEKILGYFAHNARPGLLLMEDWMYKRNGRLGKLVDVLTELELYACLEVIHECAEEYEAKLVNTNMPREDDDDNGGLQGGRERYGHDIDTAPSSTSSDFPASSTLVSSSDCNSTEQTTSMPSECSTTSSLPPSLPYVVTTSLDTEIENLSSGTTDCNKEPQGKCFSSDNLKIGGGIVEERPGLFRYKSWSPSGEHEPDKDERNLNRSISHEPKDKKSKEGKKSFGKRFVRMFSKTKRHKKSQEQSTDEGNSNTACVGSGESSLEAMVTSSTAMDVYSEAAEKPCANLSPLKVTEARKLSITDSLSSGESVSSPVSPGYESGYMSSEGPCPSVSSGKTISIIHYSDLEDKSFQEEVWKLYNHFGLSLGYKCHLDKLEIIKVAENKFRYALRSVQGSDFVFICVSPELKRIFDSSPEEISDSLEGDEECMLRLESDLILADLAINASNRKGKFMTIMLKGSHKSDVPSFMNIYMKFHWPKDERRISQPSQTKSSRGELSIIYHATPVNVHD